MMPKTVVELLVFWPGLFRHHWNGHLWTTLFDVIYMERRTIRVLRTQRTMPELKIFFFFRILLDWISAFHTQPLCSVFDWRGFI